MAIDLEKIYRQQEVAERLAQMREVPVDELLGSFAVGDMQALDTYQSARGVDELATAPVSTDFTTAYPDKVPLLIYNRATYEDNVEDALLEDSLIAAILRRRKDNEKDRNNTGMTEAFRARRSVLAYLALRAAATDGQQGSGEAA